jgi:hypothetical protein
MADVTNTLKAELGIKSNKSEHHHQHEKTIVPSTEAANDVTHVLQSQLGQGKRVDRDIQQEKNKIEGN